MSQLATTAANDVQTTERIEGIHVSTEYISGYQCVNRIRDLPDFYVDEPKKLGGRNSGPTPLETTLAALNSCSAMIAHVLRLEQKFDLKGIRFETDGFVEVRRVEMKRTGKKYSEIEPLADHYQRVVQNVYIETSESEERVQFLGAEIERLCPLQALFRHANVEMEINWIRQPA
jgi:uncharacterized OsmC-like protein